MRTKASLSLLAIFLVTSTACLLLLPNRWEGADSVQEIVDAGEKPKLVQDDGGDSQPVRPLESAADKNQPPAFHNEGAEPGDFSYGVDELSLDDTFIDRLETIAVAPVQDYRRRHGAVQALGDDLSRDEILALYQFLFAPPPSGELERKQDRVLKNDILNRLRGQNTSPEGLTTLMAAIFANPEQDEAVRDYALQQMRAWYKDAPKEERPLIREVLLKGLEERGSSLAGTALLALRELENTADAELETEVVDAALELAHAENAADLSRITAMQVAVERRPVEVFPLAAAWAMDASATYPRRLSAIAALGAAESEEAAALLAQVEMLNDPYLEPALQSAFRRIRESGINGKVKQTR